jgi:hypothetical protein
MTWKKRNFQRRYKSFISLDEYHILIYNLQIAKRKQETQRKEEETPKR